MGFSKQAVCEALAATPESICDVEGLQRAFASLDALSDSEYMLSAIARTLRVTLTDKQVACVLCQLFRSCMDTTSPPVR